MNTVFKFRKGAHVPNGVTAEGVVSERDRIAAKHGEASVSTSVTEVLTNLDHFPNLAAWGELDPEVAVRKCMEVGITSAYSSLVVEVREDAVGRPLNEPVEIRILHPVTLDGGKRSYEKIEMIKTNDLWRREVIAQCQREHDATSRKLRNLLGELGEL